jgi:tetratricopeptide (TPR) repeat protein
MRSILGTAFALFTFAGSAVSQHPKRLSDLETDAVRDSLVPEAHYQLAMGYTRAKRYAEAGRELSRAIAIDSRYSPAYVALAFMPYFERPQLGKEERNHKVPPAWRDSLETTRRLLRQAFLIDPLVELLPPDLDRRQEAINTAMLRLYLTRRYGWVPRDSIPPGILWMRGLMDGREGAYPSAIQDFESLLRRAERIEEDSIVPFPIVTNDFRYILAVLCDRADRPADAQQYYRETLTNDLGHYMAHVRLAKLYRHTRMWNDAVEESRRALEVNPDDPAALRELGEALLGGGRLPEAEDTLREAYRRNPRDVGTEYVLGVVYEQEGRSAEARASYEHFLATAPPSLYPNQISEARRRVAALADSVPRHR